jgi:hypothetical protein
LSGLGDSVVGPHRLHVEGYVRAVCCDVMGVTKRSHLVAALHPVAGKKRGQEKSPAIRGAKSKKTVDVSYATDGTPTM